MQVVHRCCRERMACETIEFYDPGISRVQSACGNNPNSDGHVPMKKNRRKCDIAVFSVRVPSNYGSTTDM
ncbi:unnamed protein product [Macrosiphum euphorbiae]|uniref:Uncharacterized protein n=1 Tax=Macrosiphum euphorbiae TaxID=13131 RepID=A0AAV0X3J7_9HEMI|nr:unnamed protein product [Macrosiphum euphorbiae]